MNEPVLDSSAVLALLLGEPGAERVKAVQPGALLSTVNTAEVISKLCERGMPADAARSAILAIGVQVVALLSTTPIWPARYGPRPGARTCHWAIALVWHWLGSADRRPWPPIPPWRKLSGFDAIFIRETAT